MNPLFATIKNLPRQRTLTREGSTTNGYANNDAIQRTIASNVSETCSFTDSLKQDFIRHHLLFMKSVSNPYGKLAVFASQRKIVSSADAGNVPPEKKVFPVYTEVSYG